MKTCSYSAALADLLDGNLHGRRHQQLIEHIRKCRICRSVINQHEHITTLLSLTQRRHDGTLVVEVPEVSTDFVERLKTAAARAHAERQEEIQQPEQLLGYIVSQLREWWAKVSEPQLLVGYAAMPTKPDRQKAKRDTSRLMRELGDQVTQLLELLLEPAVPIETRIKWCRRLTVELRRRQRPYGNFAGRKRARKRRGRQFE